jgi:hypothetical protein
MTDPRDHVALISGLDARVQSVRTRALDLSFNELLDMHRNDELVIRPAYQRLFRWSEAQQSRFIESLLLEMPIPPLYVIEIQDNAYELIDGLQRMSSYLHFRGAHPERRNEDGSFKSLRLEECDIVKELNGVAFDELPTAHQVKLKRHFVRVEVIRKESDPRLRYYMFKRLNTGGALLSEQEVRNCTIRLLDPAFNDFIDERANDPHFVHSTEPVSESRKGQMFLNELVLRFFAFKNAADQYKHIVSEFLTDYMEFVSDPNSPVARFDYAAERAAFTKTFAILDRAMGSEVFLSTQEGGRMTGTFSVYLFEAFTLGVQGMLADLDPGDAPAMTTLAERIRALKVDPVFRRDTVGGGLNDPNPFRRRVQLASQRLSGAA